MGEAEGAEALRELVHAAAVAALRLVVDSNQAVVAKACQGVAAETAGVAVAVWGRQAARSKAVATVAPGHSTGVTVVTAAVVSIEATGETEPNAVAIVLIVVTAVHANSIAKAIETSARAVVMETTDALGVTVMGTAGSGAVIVETGLGVVAGGTSGARASRSISGMATTMATATGYAGGLAQLEASIGGAAFDSAVKHGEHLQVSVTGCGQY